MKDKKKVIIFTSLILGVLVVTLGITYSLFTFNQTGGTSKLILGDIYMHYKETNQLSLSDAMPLDINNYMTYKVNSIMQEQEIVENELSRCITLFGGGRLDEGSTAESFCQGTGTFNGMTLHDFIDLISPDPNFLENLGQQLLDDGVILSNGDGTYKVNPIMKEQDINELTACINYVTNLDISISEGEDFETFCKGTGTYGGMTLQDVVDEIYGVQPVLSDNSTINAKFLDAPSYSKIELSYLKENNIIFPQIENLPYFEFTISGKNTYTKEDIWYEIVLSHGNEHDTRTTRIRDDLLKFTLIEVVNGNNNILVDNKSYSDLTNKRIYVDTIDVDTKTEISRTYRLYMWISDETVLGNVNEDYTLEEWNDVFASIKVNVSGDFEEKTIAYEDIYNVTPESCFTVGTIDNNGETEVAIRNYDTSCGSDVVIPETIKGYKVGVIGVEDTGTLISSDNVNNQNSLNNLILKSNDFTNVKPIVDAILGAFQNKRLTSVVIPNTVREIYNNAFCNNQLTSIVIPKSVSMIEEGAFADNSLTSVVIPNSVTYIGHYAFYDNRLRSVTFEDNSLLESIHQEAFTGDNQAITEVTIPDSVTYLSCSAFNDDVIINKREDLELSGCK